MVLFNPSTTAFTFSSRPVPLLTPLVFPPVPPPTDQPSSLRKRHRSVFDADDNGSRKKRRLRLMLITSRLSRPFSTPASHAVDKGKSKIAVWAKSKHLGSNLLRKAAILNSMRRSALLSPGMLAPVGFSLGGRRDALIEDGERRGDERNEALFAAQHRSEVGPGPLPPSPLGLSNYDALDEDEEWQDEQVEEEWDYCPHPDVVAAKQEDGKVEEAVPARHIQPKKHKGYSDLNPLDPPASPNSAAAATPTDTRSPNSMWLAEEFKLTSSGWSTLPGSVNAAERCGPLGGMGSPLFPSRRDVMADIMQERGRQRQLLELRFE